MKRWLKFVLIFVAVLAVSPFVISFLGKCATHIHHQMQEHFAEIHAALLGDDEEFGDGMTDDQIAARDDVTTPIATSKGDLSWEILAQAQTKVERDAIKPVYTDAIRKLDQTIVTAKGYMFPLDTFGKQTHFLLSPYPPSCPFCRPAGPNELIEVKPIEPMEFTYDVVTVKGRFETLNKNDDIQQGMFYRMEDAAAQ